MSQQVSKRFVRTCALVVVAATGLVASIAAAPLAGATQTPKLQPSCTWPVSSGQIDAALGVSVKSPRPMQFTVPASGGNVRWTMCVYYGNGGTGAAAAGDVVIEYVGGVGTRQMFVSLESGFAKSKHIGHVATVHGIGSEAFYAVASRQTYLFVHVGTTMFIVFAFRPPAQVIGLGRIVARAL
ncbi:MAG: hypothetical protein ACYCXY_08840 [Acidimicrobiales bacterium]